MEDVCLKTNKDNGFYYEVWTNQSHRSLKFNELGIQTKIDLTAPFILQAPYLEAMIQGMHFTSNAKKILILGLGGGALVHYLTHYYKNIKLTVIEKEKEVVDCAIDYFLVNIKNINLKVIDAYEFIKKSQQKFDIIFADIFSLDGIMPYSLPEFYGYCKNLLSSKGTLICNNIFREPNDIKRLLTEKCQYFEGKLLTYPIKEHLNLITIGTSSNSFEKKLKKLSHNNIIKITSKSIKYGYICDL